MLRALWQVLTSPFRRHDLPRLCAADRLTGVLLPLTLIAAGILVRVRANRYYTVQEYNNRDAWRRPVK